MASVIFDEVSDGALLGLDALTSVHHNGFTLHEVVLVYISLFWPLKLDKYNRKGGTLKVIGNQSANMLFKTQKMF